MLASSALLYNAPCIHARLSKSGADLDSTSKIAGFQEQQDHQITYLVSPNSRIRGGARRLRSFQPGLLGMYKWSIYMSTPYFSRHPVGESLQDNVKGTSVLLGGRHFLPVLCEIFQPNLSDRAVRHLESGRIMLWTAPAIAYLGKHCRFRTGPRFVSLRFRISNQYSSPVDHVRERASTGPIRCEDCIKIRQTRVLVRL